MLCTHVASFASCPFIDCVWRLIDLWLYSGIVYCSHLVGMYEWCELKMIFFYVEQQNEFSRRNCRWQTNRCRVGNFMQDWKKNMHPFTMKTNKKQQLNAHKIPRFSIQCWCFGKSKKTKWMTYTRIDHTLFFGIRFIALYFPLSIRYRCPIALSAHDRVVIGSHEDFHIHTHTDTYHIIYGQSIDNAHYQSTPTMWNCK